MFDDTIPNVGRELDSMMDSCENTSFNNSQVLFKS